MSSDLEIADVDSLQRQQQWESLPKIDLESRSYDEMVVASDLVSPWLSAEFGMIAVECNERRLVLALMDPRGIEGASVIKATSNLQVTVVAAAPASVAGAQQRIYGELSGEPSRTGNRKDSKALSARELSLLGDSGRLLHGPVPAASHRRRAATGTLLGERLRSRESLTLDRLDEALLIQKRTGSRLGDVLVHWDLASDADVADALAEQAKFPRGNLLELSPETEALEVVPQAVALRLRVVPISLTPQTLHVAVDGPPRDSALEELEAIAQRRIWPIVGTRSDLESLYSRTYAKRDERVAAASLLNRVPDESAFVVLTRRQRIMILALIALVAAGLSISPLSTIVVINILVASVYIGCSVYKFKLVYNALGHSLELPVDPADLAKLDDRDLPIYTVLVPLYREANVVHKLVDAIADLDYPRSKLDIKLITEQDDPDTRAALANLDLPAHFKVLTVPNVEPKTKPKACNFGLLQAQGEIVVIYDAEDRPEPDQIKESGGCIL